MREIKDKRGQTYAVNEKGTITKLDPLKPWANKAEHKRHKKERQAERMAAGAAY